MIPIDQTKEQYIAARMERWRMTAQCQCAGHYSQAYRDAAESWDSSRRLEEWFKTPEGIEAKAELQKTLEGLVKNPEHENRDDAKPVQTETKDLGTRINETARRIVGDHVILIYGAPSMGAYKTIKGDELVHAIEDALLKALEGRI